MGLCFRRIITQYISGTKPDGTKPSGFFISNFKKGRQKMKKMKIPNYYTQTEILERASANMVLLESQKEFREKLAALLSIHLGKVMMLDSGECTYNQLPSTSCFVVSPTGTGKSYVLKSLCAATNMNYYFCNCTQITTAGYKGTNVQELISKIYKDNNDFFSTANVLVFDEFDKIFLRKNNDYHNATNPQSDFLKLFEGGDYIISDHKTVNLDRSLIILAGACSELMPILRERYAPKISLGFNTVTTSDEHTDSDLIKMIDINDLVSYGMLREIGSRVNSVLHIGYLSKNDYKTLTASDSATSAKSCYSNLMKARGCTLSITEKATDKISNIAVERNVGARTVNAVLSEQLSSAYCYLDDNEQYNKVILDTDENNEFFIRYCKGKRTEPVKARVPDDFDYETSLLNELGCESNINKFCCKLCESAQLKNQTEEQLFYSFLQTVCRYLAHNVRPSERRMDSIFKLAGATDKPYPDAVAPFEIICNDFIKDDKNNDPDEKSVFEFHFKQYSKNYLPDTRNILKKALKISSRAYFEKLSENQNKT